MKQKNPKEKQTNNPLELKFKVSTVNEECLILFPVQNLHRTKSKIPNSLYLRGKGSYSSSGAGDGKDIPDAVLGSCRMKHCTLLGFESRNIILA